MRKGWDVLAVLAGLIAAIMIGVYIGLIRQQGGETAVWFVAGLAIAALLAFYGAVRPAPGRVPALWVSGVVMGALGVLGILTIGLPILGAAALALIAAVRSGRSVPASG
jgi:hypothetical protein